jgi:FkbM family methyltransferase
VRRQVLSLGARLFERFTDRIPAAPRTAIVRKLMARLPPDQQYRLGVASMAGSLVNLSRNGYHPDLIVDVGAHKGDWTRLAADVFRASPVVMVEAEAAFQPQLEAVVADLTPRVQLNLTLLGPEPREAMTFFSMGMGSSVLEELTTAPRLQKTLPMQTLDSVLHDAASAATSILLKLDVQGYELEVLRGATATLDASAVLVLELSLLPYNRGAPLMPEVVAYLDERGFAPYDLAGTVRRYEDAALFQVDMVFVRKEHALRAAKAFWKSA